MDNDDYTFIDKPHDFKPEISSKRYAEDYRGCGMWDGAGRYAIDFTGKERVNHSGFQKSVQRRGCGASIVFESEGNSDENASDPYNATWSRSQIFPIFIIDEEEYIYAYRHEDGRYAFQDLRSWIKSFVA